jgi:hypothetical protein
MVSPSTHSGSVRRTMQSLTAVWKVPLDTVRPGQEATPSAFPWRMKSHNRIGFVVTL